MTEWAQEVLIAHGVAMLVLLILLENVFPPIPSEVILPLAGFLVFEGQMTFVEAMVAATLGSVSGAVILYALGRHGGRPLLLRYGQVLRLDERRLDRADDWFDRHGPKIVFLGRMLPGVRSVVSVPAGPVGDARAGVPGADHAGLGAVERGADRRRLGAGRQLARGQRVRRAADRARDRSP